MKTLRIVLPPLLAAGLLLIVLFAPGDAPAVSGKHQFCVDRKTQQKVDPALCDSSDSNIGVARPNAAFVWTYVLRFSDGSERAVSYDLWARTDYEATFDRAPGTAVQEKHGAVERVSVKR